MHCSVFLPAVPAAMTTVSPDIRPVYLVLHRRRFSLYTRHKVVAASTDLLALKEAVTASLSYTFQAGGLYIVRASTYVDYRTGGLVPDMGYCAAGDPPSYGQSQENPRKIAQYVDKGTSGEGAFNPRRTPGIIGRPGRFVDYPYRDRASITSAGDFYMVEEERHAECNCVFIARTLGHALRYARATCVQSTITKVEPILRYQGARGERGERPPLWQLLGAVVAATDRDLEIYFPDCKHAP
jgi:hypothetical protein